MIYQLKGRGGGGGPIIDRSIFGAFQPKPLLRKIKLKVALRKLPFVNIPKQTNRIPKRIPMLTRRPSRTLRLDWSTSRRQTPGAKAGANVWVFPPPPTPPMIVTSTSLLGRDWSLNMLKLLRSGGLILGKYRGANNKGKGLRV